MRTEIRPSVLIPTSLNEALHMLKRHPHAEIWAGGTWWLDGQREAVETPPNQTRVLVSLHAIRELRRVVRTDIQVDVGAAVPVGRLRDVGSRYLPDIVLEASEGIGPPPLKNTATIGGALCLPASVLPISTALQLLDASVELRRSGRSRWVTAVALRDDEGKLRIGRREILTRVRIPNRSWNHRRFATFGSPYPPGSHSLSLAACAIVEKTGIVTARFAAAINGSNVLRSRAAETMLEGRSVPLTDRDRRSALNAVQQVSVFGTLLDDLGRTRVLAWLDQFLRLLR